MRIYIQWFHIEVNHINDELFLLVIDMSFLLLVILEDDDFGLVERILVIEKSFNKFIYAKLIMKSKTLQFTKREKSIFECSKIVK